MSVQGEPEFIGALIEPDATAAFHAVELDFGTALAESDVYPGESKTSITWVEFPRGGPVVQVEASLDDGKTWHAQVKGKPINGTSPGDVVTGKRLLLRQLFRGDANTASILSSITWTMEFENLEVLTVTEVGGAGDDGLHRGRFEGVEFIPIFAAVTKVDQVALDWRLATNQGVEFLRNDDQTYVVGEKFELSHGETVTKTLADGQILIFTVPLGQGELPPPPWVDGDPYPPGWDTYTDREVRDAASWAAEFWINPRTIQAETLLRWNTINGISELNPGLKIVLTADGRIQLEAIQWTWDADSGVTSVVRVMETGANLITAGDWSHVAFTFDGTIADIRVNGQVATSGRFTYTKQFFVSQESGDVSTDFGLVFSMNGGFFIGGGVDETINGGVDKGTRTPSTVYTGLISEVRLYARAARASIAARWRRRLRPDEVTMMETEEDTLLRAYFPLEVPGAALFSYADDSTSDGNNLRRTSVSGWPQYLSASPFWDEVRPDGPSSTPVGIRTSPGKSLSVTGSRKLYTDAPFNITFDGKEFEGIGSFGRLSMIEDRSSLVPTGVEMELNGLDPAIISLALQANYMDQPCRIWVVLFDRLGALVVDPKQVFEGRMDQMDIAVGAVGAVRLTAESHLLDWERSSGLVWNYVQQRDLYPDDYGFEFMAEIVEKEIWWPATLRSQDPA
ncbi:MAG TPA: LamG-like jellyroll fold domain-containing protein [Acidobacteriota bacterium]|nr:LamG-like jellyroll fold domain-containing protein [Acidobacteriota bacterium]